VTMFCYRYRCRLDVRHCLARQVDVIHHRHGHKTTGRATNVKIKHPECSGCQQGAALVQLFGPAASRAEITTGYGGLARKSPGAEAR
jgi:hypothetical protein